MKIKLKSLLNEFAIGGVNTSNAFGFMIPKSEMNESPIDHTESDIFRGNEEPETGYDREFEEFPPTDEELPDEGGEDKMGLGDTTENTDVKADDRVLEFAGIKENQSREFAMDVSQAMDQIYHAYEENNSDNNQEIDHLHSDYESWIEGGLKNRSINPKEYLQVVGEKLKSYGNFTLSDPAAAVENVVMNSVDLAKKMVTTTQSQPNANLNESKTVRANKRILEFAGIKENSSNTLDQSVVQDLQLEEVLDIIDPPYVAEVAVSFSYQGKSYTGVTQALNVGGDWDVSEIGEPIEDIEPIEQENPNMSPAGERMPDQFSINENKTMKNKITEHKAHNKNLISERAFDMVGGIVTLKPIGGLATSSPTMRQPVNEDSSELAKADLFFKLPLLNQGILMELSDHFTGSSTGKNWGKLVEELGDQYYSNPKAKSAITAELNRASLL
jgi:hypothetical protein